MVSRWQSPQREIGVECVCRVVYTVKYKSGLTNGVWIAYNGGVRREWRSGNVGAFQAHVESSILSSRTTLPPSAIALGGFCCHTCGRITVHAECRHDYIHTPRAMAGATSNTNSTPMAWIRNRRRICWNSVSGSASMPSSSIPPQRI